MDYSQSVVRLPTLCDINDHLTECIKEQVKKQVALLMIRIAKGEDLSIDYLREKYEDNTDNMSSICIPRKPRKTVPHIERCMARIAGGKRCSRRRRGEAAFYCGGHVNTRPYGDFNEDELDPISENDHEPESISEVTCEST